MDETTRMDERQSKHVITLPPKQRVNLALAAVAGALAVLVLFSAHEVLAGHPVVGATPAPSARAAPPASVAPAEQPKEERPAKGKGRD